MRIRRLVLEDFKSFAGRVELAFPAGVAVIVGPNGSGKSNLVDALRWVLGEQDPAALRVRSAAGLVYRGPGGPGPRGPAAAGCHVTAVLAESGGVPDGASMAGAPLVVSRSISADGSEGYVIGEEPLERPEFLRVLRQHGVEAPLQTVIGQGEVGRLLWLHPDERARLLTQIAGASVQATGYDQREALLRTRLDEERAELLRACAPSADDPLLRSTLAALELAFPRRGDVTLEEALEAVESRIADLEGGPADRSVRPERDTFLELHERAEKRFDALFRMLTPGGSVALPLVPAAPGEELPGIDVAVRFPRRPAVPLDGLSGGQLTQVGLCLALAVFLEVSRSVLVLDEVEPALDDALLRRLTHLFAEVAQERQIIAVSHQRLMRTTADYVLQTKRDESGSRVDFQYDPRLLRAPGAFSR